MRKIHGAWRLSTGLVGCLLLLVFLLPMRAGLANPQTGEITVEGTVASPPPSTAPQFTSPTNNQTFTDSPITTTGACIAGTIVEVYKNGVFAGSGSCASNGTFSIVIDLFFGSNVLVAKQQDSLGQYSPDSNPITVTYSLAPSPNPNPKPLPPTDVAQLLLTVGSSYRGGFPGKPITIEPQIIGGVGPYAIKIEWGDGQQSLVARQINGSFSVKHTYTSAGVKIIKITATDADGQQAFVQTTAVINGEVAVTTTDGQNQDQSSGTGWSGWRTFLSITGFTLFIFVLLTSYFLGKRHGRQQEQGDQRRRDDAKNAPNLN